MWWCYPIHTHVIIMIIFVGSVFIALDILSYKYISNRSIILYEHFIFIPNGVAFAMYVNLCCVPVFVIDVDVDADFIYNQHCLLKIKTLLYSSRLSRVATTFSMNASSWRERETNKGAVMAVCVKEREIGAQTQIMAGSFVW